MSSERGRGRCSASGCDLGIVQGVDCEPDSAECLLLKCCRSYMTAATVQVLASAQGWPSSAQWECVLPVGRLPGLTTKCMRSACGVLAECIMWYHACCCSLVRLGCGRIWWDENDPSSMLVGS